MSLLNKYFNRSFSPFIERSVVIFEGFLFKEEKIEHSRREMSLRFNSHCLHCIEERIRLSLVSHHSSRNRSEIVKRSTRLSSLTAFHGKFVAYSRGDEQCRGEVNERSKHLPCCLSVQRMLRPLPVCTCSLGCQ